MKTTRKDAAPRETIRQRLAPSIPVDRPASASSLVALDLAVESRGGRLGTLVVPPIYVSPSPPGGRALTFDDIVFEATQISATEFRTSDGLAFHLSDTPIGGGAFSYVHLVQKSDNLVDQIYALKEMAVGPQGGKVRLHRLYNDLQPPSDHYHGIDGVPPNAKGSMTLESIVSEVNTALSLRLPSAPHFVIRVRVDENGRKNDRVFVATPVLDVNAAEILEEIHANKEEIEQLSSAGHESEKEAPHSYANYAFAVHLFHDGIMQLSDYHRTHALLDIKPENILTELSPAGKHHLSDLGLSETNEKAYISSGTPNYMAPEIFFTRAPSEYPELTLPFVRGGMSRGTSSDIFAFGRTLIEATLGDLPYFFDFDTPNERKTTVQLVQHADDLARWAVGDTNESFSGESLPVVADYVSRLFHEAGPLAPTLLQMTALNPALRPEAESLKSLAKELLGDLMAPNAPARLRAAEREYREVLRDFMPQTHMLLAFDPYLGDPISKARALNRLKRGATRADLRAIEAMRPRLVTAARTALAGRLFSSRQNNSLTSMRRSDWLLPLGNAWSNAERLFAPQQTRSKTPLTPTAIAYISTVFAAEIAEHNDAASKKR